MTVQELIDQLSKIENKGKTVSFIAQGFDELRLWPVACAWEYDFRGQSVVLLDRERLSLGAVT